MAVSQDNMWLIVSLTTVIIASNLLLQTQIVLLFQIWQHHQSGLLPLKDVVTSRNSAHSQYRRMRLRHVLFLIQKARLINK